MLSLFLVWGPFGFRMDELAEKCNHGRLTSEEREEYETSVRFANYLALIQAKARRLLKVSDRT